MSVSEVDSFDLGSADHEPDNEYSYDYGDSLPPEDPDPLFGSIEAGMQADGTLIADLGWAGFALLENLGIESMVGQRGFASADEFYRWMQAASGSPLRDWFGVQLRLYEAWYLAPFEENYCYATWRENDPGDALKVIAVDVFCLRHIAWSPEAKGRRAFSCARNRSYYEAAHAKKHPDVPSAPAIMSGYQGDGLLLTGVMPGQAERVVLDWPIVDMATAFQRVASVRAAGATEVRLVECGLGIEIDALTDVELARLLKVDQYHGGDAMLIDVAAQAGLLQR